MSHMKKQITSKQNWLAVETTQGTEFLPIDLIGDLPDSQFLDPDVTESDCADIQQYCEGTVQSWENIQGYGARLSAQGYLDCTPWSVFETVDEAKEYLEDAYGDDDDDDDDDEA